MCTICQRWVRSGMCVAWTGTVLLLLAAPVQAGMQIGVTQDPPLPMGPFLGDDNNEDMIMVGNPSQPIVVTPDPSSTTPWMKQFVINRDGQGWSPGTSGPNSMVSVMEFITFPPTSVPVVDWHEDIDPTVGDGGNFKWAGGSIDTPLGSFPGATSTDGRSIWFEFPPLPPGVPIKITKNLMWNDGVITPGPNGSNNYIIKINERPSIPEPSTLLLASLGLALFRCSVRRR